MVMMMVVMVDGDDDGGEDTLVSAGCRVAGEKGGDRLQPGQ